MATDIRHASRTTQSADPLTWDHVKIGCLQRIADSCELMAKNYSQLIQERNHARERGDYWQGEANRMARSIASLRGVITKLKKQREVSHV